MRYNDSITKRKGLIPTELQKKLFVTILLLAAILFCVLLGVSAFDTEAPQTPAAVTDEVYSYDRDPVCTQSPAETETAAESGLYYSDGSAEEADAEYLARIAREEAEKKRIEAEREAALEAERKRAEEAWQKILDATPGYSDAFVSSLTEEERAEASAMRKAGFVFYRQTWSTLKGLSYGSEGFGQCGCGPTCIAEIISNLAGVPVTPAEMRELALDWHCVLANGATTYDFLIRAAAQYGIRATQCYLYDKKTMEAALGDGKLVLVTMGPGVFTLGSHFMLYRGITPGGKILISDSYSYENTARAWDKEELYRQEKNCYWIFE